MPIPKININGYVYTDEDLDDGNCYIGNSLTNEKLAIDTLDVTVKFTDEVGFSDNQESSFILSDLSEFAVNNAVGTLYASLIENVGTNFITSEGSQFQTKVCDSTYKYGDPTKFYHGSSLIGKFYFKDSNRVGTNKYELRSISAIGILEETKHYGGVYVDVAAGIIISSIMGSLQYSIDDDVYNTLVRGWLPIASGRDNLQQVLFAIGAGIFKDANGDMTFKYLTIQQETYITDDRIYMDDGSSEIKTHCTQSNVTEHGFTALSTTTADSLFSTDVSVTSQLITFDNPYHSLVATGLTVVSSGVNYAIVSGIGSLTGKQYVHTQKTIAYYTNFNGKENIVNVPNATLVSSLNSHNVAKRTASYYSSTSTSTIGIIMGDERPGTSVSFTDTFDSTVSGYIKSMDISISYKLKAETEVAIGFLPTEHGNDSQ